MESEPIVGTIIGWGVVAALVIGYFAAMLRAHWREQEDRKTHSSDPDRPRTGGGKGGHSA